MNPDPVYQRLRETGWRRPLTEAEAAELRAWLAAHPEARADAEAEAALSRALASLPDSPVPSNFTPRVLRAIERETTAPERASTKASTAWWRGLIPRIAVTTVVIGVGVVAYQHHQAVKREELAAAARNLVTVAGTTSLSSLAALEDFEAIRRLSQADEGLLALSEDLLSLKP
jgi:anti-sigma factor RsiW